MTDFDLAERAAHQRQRIRELDRRCTMLEAEERRLYRLLGLALRVAAGDGRDCDACELLEVLCAIDGTDPARPAWDEEAERRDAIDADLAAGERLLAQIRAGQNPARIDSGSAAA